MKLLPSFYFTVQEFVDKLSHIVFVSPSGPAEPNQSGVKKPPPGLRRSVPHQALPTKKP